jgi:hypothetical protein
MPDNVDAPGTLGLRYPDGVLGVSRHAQAARQILALPGPARYVRSTRYPSWTRRRPVGASQSGENAPCSSSTASPLPSSAYATRASLASRRFIAVSVPPG